jgi:hypothetical protein
LIEERVEARLRDAERERGIAPSITVIATSDGLVASGDSPRTIPLIPYRLARMSRIEAMDLAQW